MCFPHEDSPRPFEQFKSENGRCPNPHSESEVHRAQNEAVLVRSVAPLICGFPFAQWN